MNTWNKATRVLSLTVVGGAVLCGCAANNDVGESASDITSSSCSKERATVPDAALAQDRAAFARQYALQQRAAHTCASGTRAYVKQFSGDGVLDERGHDTYDLTVVVTSEICCAPESEALGATRRSSMHNVYSYLVGQANWQATEMQAHCQERANSYCRPFGLEGSVAACDMGASTCDPNGTGCTVDVITEIRCTTPG